MNSISEYNGFYSIIWILLLQSENACKRKNPIKNAIKKVPDYHSKYLHVRSAGRT